MAESNLGAMTERTIMQALELLPWAMWRGVAIGENVKRMRRLYNPWDPTHKREALTRGTGRSTRILVEALVKVSKGRLVYISAWDFSWENKMVDQARMWADRLGLDPKLVMAYRRAELPIRRRAFFEDCVFTDHYFGGEA